MTDPTDRQATAAPNRAGRRSAARAARRRAALAVGSAAALSTVGAVGALLAGAPAAHAAGTYEVTRLADDADPGSLRWAITQANGDAGSTITFAGGLTGTITLSSDLPVVTTTVTITGPGSSVLAVSGDNAHEQLHVHGATATVSGLTFTNPDPAVAAAPALVVTGGSTFTGTDLVVSDTRADLHYSGPLDCHDSTLTLSHSVISRNSKPSWWGAGGFLVNCTTTVTDSVVTGNTSSGAAGLYASFGSLTVERSTFADNVGSGAGGAISMLHGTATVADSTISGNSGGAVVGADATVTLTNTTVTGNVAASGSVISALSAARIELDQTTVTGNTASRSTVYGSEYGSGSHSVLVTDGTILAGNAAPTEVADCFYLRMQWYSEASVIGSTTFAVTVDLGGNQTGVTDPRLADLADNGGPTQTRALLSDSPAIDAGPATAPTEWDQRGAPYVRKWGDAVDVGAYEVQPAAAATLEYVGVTEVPAGSGTVELAARVGPPDCRTGAVVFSVDGLPVATVPVDPTTGLAAVTTAFPVGATAFAVEVRLEGEACVADPVRVTVAVVGGAPSFTG